MDEKEKLNRLLEEVIHQSLSGESERFLWIKKTEELLKELVSQVNKLSQ